MKESRHLACTKTFMLLKASYTAHLTASCRSGIPDPPIAFPSTNSAVLCHAVGITYPARVIVESAAHEFCQPQVWEPEFHAINSYHSSGLKVKSPSGVAAIS
jgi:hypothetical protein